MLTCPKCGVPLRKSEGGADRASCKYCGSVSLIVSREPAPQDAAAAPEPDASARKSSEPTDA